MKPKYRSLHSFARSVSLAAIFVSFASAPAVFAVNATWNGTTDSTWATPTNWSATPVPGPGDLAIFANAGGVVDTIDLGAGITIRNVLFDTANAAAYTLGAGAIGSQTLTLEGTGAITMNSTVAVNELINANLNLGTAAGAEAFTITNSKPLATNSLTVAGGVSTTQSGTKTLTVNGTGIVTIGGPITNGSGTLALTKAGGNVLTLAGASTYTGGTTITGILNAASKTALGTGPVTVNGATGNQLQLATGANVANALTINGGGAVAQGVLYVPTGSATYSGPINVTAAANAGGIFATGSGTLTIAGDNTITTTVPITVRNGVVVYTGAQNYTTGTNLANVASAIQFTKTTSMPATGAVVLGATTTLAANVGGAGEFTLGAGTSTAGTIGGLIAGVGGQGAGVTLSATSSIGIDTSHSAGVQTWSAPFTTTNNLGLVKLGTGTLALTNGGTYAGGGSTGFPFIARQGTLLLGGGTHTVTGEAVIGGTFGRSAGDSGLDAKLQIDAGALNISGYLSVGRGNGIGVASSDLVLNNAATVTAANISAGYNGGNGANLPKGSLTLNNTSALTISGNGVFNLAESTGSNMTMTLNNSSTFIAAGTGLKYIGQGGTGVLNINGSSTVALGTGTAYVGYQAGNGTLNMTGGTFTTGGELQVGGSNTSGTAPNGTGTFTMTGGTATVNALSVARGNNNQNTVSGSVTVGAGATLNSVTDTLLGFAGNANLGKLTVSGGTVNVGTASARTLIMAQYDTSSGELDVSSGNLNLLNNSSIKGLIGNTGSSGSVLINQTGGAITFFSDAGTTVGGTGVLDLALSGSGTSTSTYNLDGGTLTTPAVVATNAVGSRLFNFNGGTLKAASNGTLLNLGFSSFVVRANVRDAGAIIDTNGKIVSVPQALEQSNVAGDLGTGGLTKLGAGTLTLSGFSTYTGATNVEAGLLALDGYFNSNVIVKSGASVSGVGSTTGSLTLNAGSTFSAGVTGGFLSAEGVTFTGATTLVFNGIPTNGTQYTLFSYGSGGVTGLSNLSSSFRTVITNDTGSSQVLGTVTTASLTWNTTNGTWAKGTTGWSGAFSSYFNGDTVTFNERPASSTVTLGGVLTPAGITVNNTSNPYIFTGTGSIAGETTLVKNGAGALTIATANSYTGGTTLNAGTLNINSATALGTGAFAINGGTINNSTASAIVMTNNITQNWDADIAFTGTSSLDLGLGAVTIGGTGTDRTVTVSANTLAVGEISAPSQGLVKQGAGTLEVASSGAGAAASVVSGTLNVAAGTLQINRTGALGASSGDFTSAGINGSGTITNGAASPRWVFSNPAAGSFNFSGTLADGGTAGLGFDKGGEGTQTLSGANSYTDVTTVAGGELIISGANSGAGTPANITGGKLTLANPQALGLASLIRPSGVDVTTLALATDTDGVPYAFSMGTGTSTAIVSGRATPGPGINHTLTTQSLANGIGGGTINITSGPNVTSGIGRITFTQFGMGSGGVQTTTLNPTSANVTLGNVSKQNNDVSQTIGLGGTSTGNLVTGVISNGPALTTATNNVSVSKTNTSTWTLTGTNTYTGPTSIDGGTLVIGGDNSAATGAVTVAANATLGGNGNIGGSVTISAGGHHALAVAGSPGGQVTRIITGSLTHSFGDNLDLAAASQPVNGTYTLATANGGIVSTPTTVTYTGIAGGSVSVVGNSLVLTVTGGIGGSAYDTFASSNGLTAANNGATQDPDFDGIANALEFVLGGNPLASDTSKLPVLTTDANNFIFTFKRTDESKSEIGLTFQYGSTLTGWTDVAIGTTSSGFVTVADNGTAPDTVTVTIPKSLAVGGKLFGRLVAVK